MPDIYPEIAPYEHGMLAVGDGDSIYWETCGNPRGKPAVVIHGGPGSGCISWHRRLFDPSAYRVVLFDQRNCGRSAPNASAPETSLAANTTANLVDDINRVREHLGIERWLMLGGSWGSVLALAYAEKYPERVSEMILWGVATGRHKELEWLFRGGIAPLFPDQWDRLCSNVPERIRRGDIVSTYYAMLQDSDPAVREKSRPRMVYVGECHSLMASGARIGCTIRRSWFPNGIRPNSHSLC
jgi:proline iminopeptidase